MPSLRVRRAEGDDDGGGVDPRNVEKVITVGWCAENAGEGSRQGVVAFTVRVVCQRVP